MNKKEYFIPLGMLVIFESIAISLWLSKDLYACLFRFYL